jgi:hypothetical protein
MNVFAKSLSVALVCTLSTLAFSQAPIVRQPPSSPDASQPAYSAPPADNQPYPSQSQQPYPQQNQQPYPQQNQQPYPAGNQQPYPQQGQPYPPAAPDPGQQPPPPMSPQQLDHLVNRIALYPDPLLAQTLTASTYWDQIPDAAAWANQHAGLQGDALGAAITADSLPWDPSILALLPFPSVLDMMARDPNWTGQLGNAVLSQHEDVMDSVQRLRQQAYNYGYLRSNSDVNVVDQGGYVEIQPFNPYLFYVPMYDPLIVFGRPRPGVFVGGAIRFGPAVTLGVSFGRFGWFGSGFGWGAHTLLIDHRPWLRTYANRAVYVHPYAHPYVRPAAPRIEHHPAPRRNDHDHNHY